METTEAAEKKESTETEPAVETNERTETTPQTEKTESGVHDERKGRPERPETIQEPLLSRKNIAIRLLFTLIFVVTSLAFTAVLWVIVLFQYLYLFIARSHSDSLKNFCNKLSVYVYRVFRYMSLNENARPFPFAGFPEEMEPPDPEVLFD